MIRRDCLKSLALVPFIPMVVTEGENGLSALEDVKSLSLSASIILEPILELGSLSPIPDDKYKLEATLVTYDDIKYMFSKRVTCPEFQLCYRDIQNHKISKAKTAMDALSNMTYCKSTQTLYWCDVPLKLVKND
jgi:hypothetical protein